MDYTMDKIKENKTALIAAGSVVGIATGAYIIHRSLKGRKRAPKTGPYPVSSLPADCYDVVIVGAGPSGSTAGYFLSKAGAKVALLDKEKFPRDKYCGDAVCTPALRILEEMGVVQALVKNNEAHFADSGGFVSPSGLAYIGASKKKLGEAAACAVKRIHLDKRIVEAATSVGANLMEEFEVSTSDVTFDKATGIWTVKSITGKEVKGRALLCADGATSRLATALGYCTEPPKGVCSRSYIEGGSHNTDFDGVCFYQRESLPGYSAIFKHANEELGFCYYLIPCGKEGMCGDVTESDLKRLHEDAIKNDPFVSKALGPNPKVERMKAGSLRLGSQGVRTTFDDHLMIIGDAAGHIDPLTGEGIHTAIMDGKFAAEVVLDMRSTGDFSKASTKAFEDAWMKAYGYDFPMSKKGAELMYRYPILLDACANEMQRQGDSMMSKWAEVMTNMRPKTYFLRPDVALPLGVALLREIWHQKIAKRPDPYKAAASDKE